ncbi:hypothetical protein PQR53_07685 [Paraburkholderia fungorum]|uniref:hypothetical protein n=1 Tax=Paraburkholderia fungorum TaxID=134537 RepID=UPI0038B850C8
MQKQKKRRAPQRARRFSIAASSVERLSYLVVPWRMKHAPRISGSKKKNPGLSPGKRYAIQRIGAFGQIQPCKRQRHDAVACSNAGPASKAGRRDMRLET